MTACVRRRRLGLPAWRRRALKGNDARRRPGYDTWISFRGQGTIVDPMLWEDGVERQLSGYVTDVLLEQAVDFVRPARTRPFALLLSHKAVPRTSSGRTAPST